MKNHLLIFFIAIMLASCAPATASVLLPDECHPGFTENIVSTDVQLNQMDIQICQVIPYSMSYIRSEGPISYTFTPAIVTGQPEDVLKDKALILNNFALYTMPLTLPEKFWKPDCTIRKL